MKPLNIDGDGDRKNRVVSLNKRLRDVFFALQQIPTVNRHMAQQTKVDTSVFCQQYKSKQLQLNYNKITVFYK